MEDIDSIKSAPMCEETVLWFEFLLKPELLEGFLKNEKEGSAHAISVMGEFLGISGNENPQQVNEINSPDSDSLNKCESLSLKLGRKQLALKILSLKVASYLNFNLEIFEKCLPIQKQIQLLSDLASVASGRLVNLPLSLVHEVPLSPEGNKAALNFALTLYHRWLLRAHVLRGNATRSKPFVHIMTTPDQPNNNSNPDDKFFAGIEPFTPSSIEFLNQIIDDPDPFRMLTFESFVPLKESSSKLEPYNGQKFDKSIIISKTELKAQIYYDLCAYNIFIKKYDIGKEMILLCRDNLNKLKQEHDGNLSSNRFCTVTDDDLRGYLLACGILDHKSTTLFQRFNESILNKSNDLETILNEDNFKREIPFIHRKTLEVEQDKSGNEYFKLLALNTIRFVLDTKNILTSDTTTLNLKENAKRLIFLKYFIQYSNDIHQKLSLNERFSIRNYLLNFLVTFSSNETEIKESKYFEKNEVEIFKKQKIGDPNIHPSGIGLLQDWNIPDVKNHNDILYSKILFGDLERKLVVCMSPKQIRKLLVELAKFNPQMPLWAINKNWFIPADVRIAVLNLKRGFLQDFAYILLGKSNELLQKKDYTTSISLLTELRSESKRPEWSNDMNVNKLGKLLDWEKFNIQIIQRLENYWPNKPPTIKDPWIVKLKQMVGGINNEMPRLEIIENSMFMLLNVNDWNSCLIPESNASLFTEICSIFSAMMVDMQQDTKNKNLLPRKREFWDFILPIFLNNSIQQQNQNPKRSQNNRRSSESPARFVASAMNISVFKQFLDKMRDSFAISILLSMLSKMHNLLKDDTNMELSIENFHLWPQSISNKNMDAKRNLAYENHKLTVKRWEREFQKKNKRIPSKDDIRDAPTEVRQSYKMYYKMKTEILSLELSGALEEEDTEISSTQPNSSSYFSSELEGFSESYNEVSHINESYDQSLTEERKVSAQDNQDYENYHNESINKDVWNEKLNKKKSMPHQNKKILPTLDGNKKKWSLMMEPITLKPLRNPRKPFSKNKLATSKSLVDFHENKETLPDLETILLQKTRSKMLPELKKIESTSVQIKNSVNDGWLERNTITVLSSLSHSEISKTSSSLTNTSSFGLSNLNLKSFASSSSLICRENSTEIKFHASNESENEIIGNSDDEDLGALKSPPLLPVAKKRRLSTENLLESPKKESSLPEKSQTLETIKEFNDSKDHSNDSEIESNSPVMKRKRSMLTRSKKGISKITEKAKKIFKQSKKSSKKMKDETSEERKEDEEEEINFMIDSDPKSLTTVPRVSQKELNMTEKIFNNYVNQANTMPSTSNNTRTIIDSKTAAKKEILKKKIAAGTLNDNFVSVNLKKKVFVRGKKAFSFSKYKKTMWKIHSTKPDTMPSTSNEIWKMIDEESDDDEEFDDMEELDEILKCDKENRDRNSELINHPDEATVSVNSKVYIGQKIPEDFLKRSGILDEMCGSFNTEINPVYKLNSDGTLPATPKEVFEALNMFGFKEFRCGQEQAIMRVLCGMSTLVTLSTGSGKSLCYQLPAFLYRKVKQCITLVISPLVSLMEDQVHGIPDFLNAQCLHTNQTPKQRLMTMEAIKSGKVEILLVSPEAVVAGEKSTGFGSLLRQLPPIAFACIDEAHCVSQWSHNFRPSYLMICRVLREKLGVKTVLGLTATATLQTRESIVHHLSIPDGINGIISDIPLPNNLILTISKDENRDQALMSLLRSERFSSLQSIIVYCTRRDECERIAGFLRTYLAQENSQEMPKTFDKKENHKKRKRNNLFAEAYHAGLAPYRRRSIQNHFMCGDLRVVVATIAFGMGINKSNIRGIIHYNMPKSFESYVQEVGRAGRDGKEAHCHVFLDSKGNDLCELRRHIYSNSIDRHVIRKLLRKVFVPCSCSQSQTRSNQKSRCCPGHEVCFSIDQTVQLLDIPQENISTLLCYLELHEQCYIKVLIDVAAAICWDSGVVKYQLKQLEWTVVNGASKRSSITVTFSDLGFRIRSPGDLTDEELDSALDSLEKRTSSQEKTQLIQFQLIYLPSSEKNTTDCLDSRELKQKTESKTAIHSST
ncbi:CLUMA_CG011191, isoform A [Clunio marinus]|uniref:ATP-dependent DNA helicase Q4 n=1 Tax=Clunio marinus TaxID=568069 RepID=A0A1J1IC05_9DIPT|nr:CLUMA_CG011191, isoform A [Clunio marinus]